MSRTFKLALTLALAVGSFVAVTAQAAPAPQGPGAGIPMCSDSGRACSVDRNCCSGSCVHGNCQ